MPGFELFDDKEKKQIDDVMSSGILFRYGFDNLRNNHWKAKTFEIELATKLGVKYCHLCSSGTAALSAAISACGIGINDEIIVPPFTFVATIEAIILAGAIPVFGEIDETLCLSPDNLASMVTNKTKAILVVHMCGSMAKIDKISNFCKANSLVLIEDACQALGGTFNGQALGSFGKIGCFSFDFVKTITCGEGGAIITNSHSTYLASDSFSDHGHTHLSNDRGAEKPLTIGTNLRINELNAAIGLAQLRKLDKILEIQKKNKTIIKSALKSINELKFRELPDEKGDSATFLSFIMPSAEKAKKVMSDLNKAGIDGCFYWFDNNWHYIKQWDHLKKLKLYANLPTEMAKNIPNYKNLKLPYSDSIMEKTISIQIKLGWRKEELEKLANNLTSIVGSSI